MRGVRKKYPFLRTRAKSTGRGCTEAQDPSGDCIDLTGYQSALNSVLNEDSKAHRPAEGAQAENVVSDRLLAGIRA